MPLSKRAAAEFIGTFWLVFGGCGSAVLAAAFPQLGIGFLGVALAFGLTVMTMAFAIGHISGCHLNPAVSVGLMVAKRFPAKDLPAYVVAQVLGGMAGAGVLYVIATGKPGFELRRLRLQRLRREFSRRLLAGGLPGGRTGAHLHVPDDHSRFHRPARPARLRADRHRPGPDADSPDRHPGDESLGQSGAQHGTGGDWSAAGRSSNCGSSGWRRLRARPSRASSTP